MELLCADQVDQPAINNFFVTNQWKFLLIGEEGMHLRCSRTSIPQEPFLGVLQLPFQQLVKPLPSSKDFPRRNNDVLSQRWDCLEPSYSRISACFSTMRRRET